MGLARRPAGERKSRSSSARWRLWAESRAKKHGRPAVLDLRGIDIEPGWAEVSSELVQAHTTPRASLLDASYRFHIADNAMWATVSTVDLVLASWVWSEMINNPAASAYWNRMCQEMRAGGVLIVLDRNEERVDAFLRTFINFSPRLRLLASYQDTDHAGFFYEDEVRDKYRPRLNFGAHAYLLAVA